MLRAVLCLSLAASFALAAAPPVRSPKVADYLSADSEGAIGMRDWKGFEKRAIALAQSLGNDRVGQRLPVVPRLAEMALCWTITNEFAWVEPGDNQGYVLGHSLTPTEREKRRAQKQPEFIQVESNFVHPGVHLRDRTLLSDNKKSLERYIKSPSLSPVLSPSYRRAMNEADLLVHFNLALLRKTRPDDYPLRKAADFKPEGEAEQAVTGQLEALQHSLRWLLLTARVDQGVGLRLRAEWDDKLRPEAARLLQSLDNRGQRSHLRGLPLGRVVLAQATAFNGAATAVPLKLTTRGFLSEELFKGGAMASVAQAAEHPLLSSAFASLWQRFPGRRLALYHNRDESKHGLFGLVSILDTDDPDAVLKELDGLARLTRGDELDLGDKGRDVAQVRQLVEELGHEDYPVRERATAKLTLTGPVVLPFVRKAAEAGNPEQKRRARRLVAMLEEVRKRALSDTGTRIVQPRFALERDAEKRDGVSVHHLRARLTKADAGYVPLLTQMLGPKWDTLRLAVVGKQIVVLAGSETGLFDRAVSQVRKGEAGLEADPLLERFRRHTNPQRKFEAHVALEAAAALEEKGLDPAKLKTGQLSSVAVTLDRSHLGVDVWIAPAGLRPVLEKLGWWFLL